VVCAPRRRRKSLLPRTFFFQTAAGRDGRGPSSLHKAELFTHPTYGRAVRATESIPAGTVVLKERPFFAFKASAEVTAEAAKARAVRAAALLQRQRGRRRTPRGAASAAAVS
jgi:hypothetical protein